MRECGADLRAADVADARGARSAEILSGLREIPEPVLPAALKTGSAKRAPSFPDGLIAFQSSIQSARPLIGDASQPIAAAACRFRA